MSLWLLITGIPALAYVLLMVNLFHGWKKINPFSSHRTSFEIGTHFSIIIPYKNEANNLPALITRLKDQTLPAHLFEFLFINDHSSDAGPSLVESFCNQHPSANHLQLNSKQSGKKEALSKGIAHAKHDILISLDADVMPGKNWLYTIKAYWDTHHPDAIIAPVYVHPGNKALHIFEALDVTSLVASGAGSAGIDRPFLCNGANFIFTRQDYLSSNNLKEKTPSGDDIFLLLHLKKNKTKKIHFLKSMDAAVAIKPQETIKDFIKQRIRWGSKSQYYQDPDIIFATLTVFIFNSLLAILLPISLFMTYLFPLWLGLFILKLMVDVLFLFPALRFFKLEKYSLFFLPAALIYPFYIFFTGIFSQLLNCSWKKENNKQD